MKEEALLCAEVPTMAKQTCRNTLLMCTLGRVWGKVYCRHFSEEDPARQFVVTALGNMVRQFRFHLVNEDELCSRCKGDAGLPSKACISSSVAVCKFDNGKGHVFHLVSRA